jgi:hypothetical protein
MFASDMPDKNNYIPFLIVSFIVKSHLFIKPFLHQLISQSSVQKPSLKPQTASNAGVEAFHFAHTVQYQQQAQMTCTT